MKKPLSALHSFSTAGIYFVPEKKLAEEIRTFTQFSAVFSPFYNAK